MNRDAHVLSKPTRLSTAPADPVATPGATTPKPCEQGGSITTGTTNPEGQPGRCSPDPSHQTDKYRLVTPFWLRI